MNYAQLAQNLIEVGEAVELAQRYLSIRHRLAILTRHIRDLSSNWPALAAVLENDPTPALRRLWECSNRLAIQRSYLEGELLHASSRQRFVVVAAKEDVEEALARIPKGMDRMAVLLAFCPEYGLRIGQQPVRAETGWGKGQGLAVIHRTDLAHLLEQAQYAICIEAFQDDWVGWIDSTPSGAPKGMQARSLRFSYYTAETEAEER